LFVGALFYNFWKIVVGYVLHFWASGNSTVTQTPKITKTGAQKLKMGSLLFGLLLEMLEQYLISIQSSRFISIAGDRLGRCRSPGATSPGTHDISLFRPVMHTLLFFSNSR
jgi:hypothetical protein